MGLFFLFWLAKWWTYQKPEGLSVPVVTITKNSRWLNTKSPKNQNSPKVEGVTIVNNKVSVVNPSPFWGRRQKLPRSWSSGWSAPSANAVCKSPSNVPSISNLEVTKNARVKWFNFKVWKNIFSNLNFWQKIPSCVYGRFAMKKI